MTKTKKILISLIATLTLVMSVLPVFSANIKKVLTQNPINTSQTQNEATIDGYDLANAKYVKEAWWGSVYEISDANYDNHDSFRINNLKGLLAFMGIINSCNNGDIFRNNFSGKTVYLDADIDCGGARICIGYNNGSGLTNYVFKGNFHGRSHTISNFTYGYGTSDGGLCYKYEFDPDYYTCYVGFFTYLEGKCTNLRLTNAKCQDTNSNIIFGLVAGWVNEVGMTSIENCVVEDIEILDHPNTVCGLIGCYVGDRKNLTTMYNCYVDVDGLDYSFGPRENRRTGSHALNPATIMYSVTKQVAKEGLMVDETQYNYCIYDYCITESNNFYGFYCSSLGGDSSPSTWYYGGDDFNDGWIYLRDFIEWEKLRFINGNTELFESITIVDEGELFIQVPKIFLDKTAKSKMGKEISICARTIIAEPKQSGFSGNYSWIYQRMLYHDNEKTAVYKLTSHAGEKDRRFRFHCDDDATMKCANHQSGECFKKTGSTTLEYKCTTDTVVKTVINCYNKRSQDIQIAIGANSYETIEVSCFKSITFEFVEQDGVKHSIEFLLTDPNKHMMHLGGSSDAMNQDEFLGANIDGTSSKTINGEWKGETIFSNSLYTIYVRAYNKEYNLNVGSI